MSKPVWITGVGLATPLGHTFDAFADALLAGKSGIRAITAFDASKHKCRIGGCMDPHPMPQGHDPAEYAKLLPLDQTNLWCAESALKDADWADRGPRLGLVLGSDAEWGLFWERDADRGGRAIIEPDGADDGAMHILRRGLKMEGPGITAGAACASANYALGIARRWIEAGWVDACLVGGCDRPLTNIGVSCFANLGALSLRNDDPTSASRPFDRGRDGFVVGEGGAMMLIESAASARKRGARPYADFAGSGASGDAYHSVAPNPDPAYTARAVRAALADAGVRSDQVDYINAHATSTPLGDLAEARTLQLVFDGPTVPVSSIKGMTGHMLSGASAVEAVACLVAIQRNALPPTVNLDDPDPECELLHVANAAWERKVDVSISNSFGFGGSNSCTVFRRAA